MVDNSHTVAMNETCTQYQSSLTAIPTIDWSSSASKSQFIEFCTANGSEAVKLRQIFYDVCNRAISGSISRFEYVTSALRDVVISIPSAAAIFVDVLFLFDVWSANDAVKVESKRRENFIAFLSACNENSVCDVILKERLDYETTGDARIIPNKKVAQSKFVKLKTRLYYKQQKFNLLREESEGYAKLITELNQVEDFDVSSMNQVIRSLIGCFNLDPNRVLDVMLESFESRLHLEKSYVPLISKFLDNETTLTQVLALKFNFYQNKRTPESLYLLAAVLISNDLIDLTELLSYLLPKDTLIETHHNYLLDQAKKIIRKATVISTAEEKEEVDPFNESERFSLFFNNQKLGLCHALTKVGNWTHSRLMIESLMPPDYCLGVEAICTNLAHSVAVSIDSLYTKYSSLPETLVAKIPPLNYPHIRFIKPVESVKEFIEQTVPMLCLIGPYLYVNTLVMVKLIRICKSLWPSKESSCSTNVQAILEQEQLDESTLRSAILDLLDQCILPAVTVIDSNPALSEELWLLLKLIPYESRYRLYYGWKQEPTVPLLMKIRAASLSKIKYIMRRLSKETWKQYGRQIGKLSHSNPVFLFQNILSQIQSYDNLIGPVVDSLKYLTPLSYDVLIYCIIEVLADSSKGRTQADGASISPWILSLANFCGCVVKKYPCELPGLLQFIANQLKSEKSLDLFVLKEIVNKMAGIEATEQMTNDQLAALSGGELLRQEGGYFNQVRNTRKSSIRLKNALIENNLALPLCMLMAQQRNCIIYRDQEYSHLKLVGKLYDQCQETLVQFGSFLSNCLSIDDYSGRIPPLDQLLTSYNLNPDVAFFLVRPMIAHRICVKYEELRKTATGLEQSKLYLQAWDGVTAPLVESILSPSPSSAVKSWDELSPRLFVTFWILSMYDLEVPKTAYDKETEKVKQQIQQLEDMSNITVAKKKKDIEKSRMLLEKLLEEQLLQDQHVSRVRSTLDAEKDQWFKSKLLRTEMTTQFFQHCIFPRCIFSASDALFCAKFIVLLHTLKTPNFSTLVAIDRIFADITFTMCSCTENEANNYGRFLAAILDTITRWHMDKNVFEKECATFPGFVAKFSETINPCHVKYEDYRHVCHKWHYRMTKAVILCFDSGEYLQIRNSLLILTKILNYFPVVSNFAHAIDRRVEDIRTKEKDNRKDLYALATGYIGQLKARKPFFMPEASFHITNKHSSTTNINSNSVQSSSCLNTSNQASNQATSSSQQQQQQPQQLNSSSNSNSSSTQQQSQQQQPQQAQQPSQPAPLQQQPLQQPQQQPPPQQTNQQLQQPTQQQQQPQQQMQQSSSPSVQNASPARNSHQSSSRSQSPASAAINNSSSKNGSTSVKIGDTGSSKSKRASTSTPDNPEYHSSSSKKKTSSSQDSSSSSSGSSSSKKRSSTIVSTGNHNNSNNNNNINSSANVNNSSSHGSNSQSLPSTKGQELFDLIYPKEQSKKEVTSGTLGPSSVVCNVSGSQSSSNSTSKKRPNDSSSRSMMDSPDRMSSRSKKSKIDSNQSNYSSHSSSNQPPHPPPLPPYHSSQHHSHHRMSSSSQNRYSSGSGGSSGSRYHR